MDRLPYFEVTRGGEAVGVTVEARARLLILVVCCKQDRPVLPMDVWKNPKFHGLPKPASSFPAANQNHSVSVTGEPRNIDPSAEFRRRATRLGHVYPLHRLLLWIWDDDDDNKGCLMHRGPSCYLAADYVSRIVPESARVERAQGIPQAPSDT